jgi:DNA-binding NarL/FixJ family response regulator
MPSMTTDPIRVVVADDDDLVRELVAGVVAGQADMVVVGSAGDGLAALALVREQRPDVAVIDLVMPHGGTELTRALLAEAPELCIVVFSSERDVAAREAVLRAGAIRFVHKSAALDIAAELRSAVAERSGRPPTAEE